MRISASLGPAWAIRTTSKLAKAMQRDPVSINKKIKRKQGKGNSKKTQEAAGLGSAHFLPFIHASSQAQKPNCPHSALEAGLGDPH